MGNNDRVSVSAWKISDSFNPVLAISGITEKTWLIVDYSTLKIIKVTDVDGVEREISNISNLPTNIFIKCEIKSIWP